MRESTRKREMKKKEKGERERNCERERYKVEENNKNPFSRTGPKIPKYLQKYPFNFWTRLENYLAKILLITNYRFFKLCEHLRK